MKKTFFRALFIFLSVILIVIFFSAIERNGSRTGAPDLFCQETSPTPQPTSSLPTPGDTQDALSPKASPTNYSPEAGSAPAPLLMATPTPTPPPEANWVLYSDRTPDGAIHTDDILYVFLNGSLIFESPDTYAGPDPSIYFTAEVGDQLRVVAEDYWGGWMQISPLFLRHIPTGKIYPISPGFPNTYVGNTPYGIFFDQTFEIQLLGEVDAPGATSWESTQSGEETGDCQIVIVNLTTGNVIHSSSPLLSHSSLGPSFAFTPTYNSMWSYSGPLGYGWTHNYNISLKESTGGSVVETDEIGTQYAYAPGTGGYTAPPGRNSVLVKNSDGTFLLTEKSQLKKRFGSNGKLLAIIDENNNAMTFGYTGDTLTTITDASGREAQLTYNADNRIVKITDPGQRSVEFSYDSDNLVKVKDEVGFDTTYAYNSDHKLTSITSYDNKTYTLTYNEEGKCISSTNYAQDTTQTAYDSTSRTYTTTDSRGNKTIRKTDEKGRTISVTEPSGAETQYEWDDKNNITKTIDPRGGVQEFTYDEKGNVLTSKDQLGYNTTYTYTDKNQVSSIKDALNNTRQFFYDNKGNLLREVDTNGNIVASYTYDNNGLMTSKTDASGNTYHYTHDQYGNLIEEKDPLGHKTVHTYSILDWLTSTTDAKGSTTCFSYCPKGYLIETKYPDNTTTKNEYLCCGLVKSTVDANLNKTEYFYTDNRLLEKVRDASGAETCFEYDDNGNKIAVIDPKGKRTSLSYDANNRLSRVDYPDGTSESYSYNLDGTLASKTDGNRSVTAFEYDPVGRLEKKSYPDGSEVSYSFDAVGNRTSMTDSTGTYQYAYDNLYRPTRLTLPSGKSIGWSYDSAGNRTGMVDYEGKSYGYSYNQMNQLKTLTLPGKKKVQYIYDQLNSISKVSYPNDTYVSYSYNNMNRIEKISNMREGILKKRGDKLISEFEYSYDNVGNRLSMSDATKFGRKKVTEFSYDPLYRLENVSYSNNTKETYHYDLNSNRTLQETVKRYFSLLFDGWTWDIKGSDEFIACIFHPRYVTYITESDFDNANKLLETRDKKKTEKRTFLEKTTKLNYDGNGNQVKGSILYAGCEKAVENTYAYNYENLMTEALMKGLKQYQFTYNSDGQRVSTTVATLNKLKGIRLGRVPAPDVTQHFYDGSNMIMDVDGKGKVTAMYSYGLGLTAIESKSLNGFYHGDALGSVTEITGKNGAVARSYRYDSWGKQTSGDDYGDLNPFRYVGKYGVRWQDRTLGLFHMGFRHYPPNIGRFIQRDPMGVNIVGTNLYTYAKNNPIINSDPTGLYTFIYPSFTGGEGTVENRRQRVDYYHTLCLMGFKPRPPWWSGENPSFLGGYAYQTGCKGHTPRTTSVDEGGLLNDYISADRARVKKCAIFHEAVHARQCICKGEDVFSLGASLLAQFELPAYYAELMCLSNMINDSDIDTFISKAKAGGWQLEAEYP